MCNTITEFGTRFGISTIAFLHAQPQELWCYDLVCQKQIDYLIAIAARSRCRFKFTVADVLKLEIAPTDLLFIDTWHVYTQMRDELLIHGNKAQKYLIFHDTETFGEKGQTPEERGIWPAIGEFCRNNPHWKLAAHFTNNNGLTVLSRAQ